MNDRAAGPGPQSGSSPQSGPAPAATSFPAGITALDDEFSPLFSVGQVAAMLEVQQAFLRRIDDHQVVSPSRSSGGQRRYSRHDIGQIQQVVSFMDQGMTLPAIRHIIALQYELADLRRQRDDLAARLDALNAHPQAEPPE